MSHYDCRRCGEYMCVGECKTETPEQLELKAAELRRETARYHRAILKEEAKRLQRIADANLFFLTHDEDGNPLVNKKSDKSDIGVNEKVLDALVS